MTTTGNAWEKRWHPLLREWVTITSHRNTRPWSGHSAAVTGAGDLHYDPGCYLCPGNTRVSGEVNPAYDGVFAFTNDHPSFAPDAPLPPPGEDSFFAAQQAYGTCRVICYSPDHSKSLSQLEDDAVLALVRCWQTESESLARDERIRQVFILENRGEVVGVSNPHPHGQIYAMDFVAETIGRELAACAAYREAHGANLFTDLYSAEQRDGRRVIDQGQGVLAFVPYFARFPYEVYILPESGGGHLTDLDDHQLAQLARLLRRVLIRYDSLWQTPMPYILTVHQAPVNQAADPDYRAHNQLHPPMRAAGLQKFLAGIETGGGNFMNDGCPEDKAAELRRAGNH